MLQVKCPYCASDLSFPNEVVGTNVACPICSKWFAVVKPVEPSNLDREDRQPLRVEVGRKWNQSDEAATWLLIVGSIAALLVLGPIIGLVWNILTGR